MYRILLSIFCLMPFVGQSQHFEIGALLGGSTYQGDLMPNDFGSMLKETHAAGGLFVRYNAHDFVTVKLAGNYGVVSGDQRNFPEDDERFFKNLNFESMVWDAGLTLEFNILGYQPYAMRKVFSPYIFGGAAVFGFNPQTEFEGQTVDLQPLGTEGQGLESYPDRQPYRLMQLAIPMGLGVKFALNDRMNLGFEVGGRMLLTDYLDDVSMTYVSLEELEATRGILAAELSDRRDIILEPLTDQSRGNNKAMDWYYIAGLTFSFNLLDNGLSGNRRRGGKGEGCYKF